MSYFFIGSYFSFISPSIDPADIMSVFSLAQENDKDVRG